MEIDGIINSFKERTIQSIIDNCLIELNDEITNGVRDRLKEFSNDEIISIKALLERILNYCYNCKLFDMETEEADASLINTLSEKELFLLKQFALYFYGRLSIGPNLDLLKKIYKLDNDKFIHLNIVYATLLSFDEEIEMDFANKLLTNPEYDLMIRSWSLAFFRKASNPYEYIDNVEVDWEEARTPRIKRLSINDEENSKYKKAMAYKLLDLCVIYLFKKSRSIDYMTTEDKEIIKNTNIDYEQFSETKKNMMTNLIEKIIL